MQLITKNCLTSSFLVGMFSLYFLEQYTLMKLLTVFYFIIDLPYTEKIEFIVHHYLASFLIIYTIFVTSPDYFIITFAKMEISSIFLVLMNFGYRGIVNKLLFFITFSYFRIYGSIKMLCNDELYEFCNEWCLLHLYFFICLNLWWYCKIVRLLLRLFTFVNLLAKI